MRGCAPTGRVFHIMAGVLAVTFVVAIRFLRRAQEPAAAAYDAPDSGVTEFVG